MLSHHQVGWKCLIKGIFPLLPQWEQRPTLTIPLHLSLYLMHMPISLLAKHSSPLRSPNSQPLPQLTHYQHQIHILPRLFPINSNTKENWWTHPAHCHHWCLQLANSTTHCPNRQPTRRNSHFHPQNCYKSLHPPPPKSTSKQCKSHHSPPPCAPSLPPSSTNANLKPSPPPP